MNSIDPQQKVRALQSERMQCVQRYHPLNVLQLIDHCALTSEEDAHVACMSSRAARTM